MRFTASGTVEAALVGCRATSHQCTPSVTATPLDLNHPSHPGFCVAVDFI